MPLVEHWGKTLILDNSPNSRETDGHVLHPGSRKLFRYWEGLRAEAPCPPRSALDLVPLKDVIPNLFILDPKSTPLGYIFRLCGTMACEILAGEQTGKDFLTGWDSFERRLIDDVMLNAVQRRQPGLLRLRLTRQSKSMTGVEMIALPFSSARNTVQLVGGLFSFAKLPAFTDPIIQRELITVRSLWTEHGAGDVLLRSVENRGTPLLRVIEGGLAKN
jgi:hypothetical protein